MVSFWFFGLVLLLGVIFIALIAVVILFFTKK